MFTRFQVNTHLRHLQVTKFVPQILDGVETNDRGTEETDPFDVLIKERKEMEHRKTTPTPHISPASSLLSAFLGSQFHGCHFLWGLFQPLIHSF